MSFLYRGENKCQLKNQSFSKIFRTDRRSPQGGCGGAGGPVSFAADHATVGLDFDFDRLGVLGPRKVMVRPAALGALLLIFGQIAGFFDLRQMLVIAPFRPGIAGSTRERCLLTCPLFIKTNALGPNGF